MGRGFSVLMSLMVFSVLLFAQSPTDEQKNEAKKLFNEGNSLYKTGNYVAAADKYKAAIEIDEDFAYHYQLGLCYKNSKQYDKAIPSFQSSIALRPVFAGSHNALAGVYLILGDYNNSIESFKTALKHDPKLKPSLAGITEAYAGKVQQLLEQGKFEEAGETSDEALQQHSDNSKLYLVAARVYNRLEKPDRALEAATQALKLKKGRSKGAEYFEIGTAYKKMKEIDKARSAFSEARKDVAYSRNAQYELDGLKGK
jgi:tetratricopeptide (TPR) repeat protein